MWGILPLIMWDLLWMLPTMNNVSKLMMDPHQPIHPSVCLAIVLSRDVSRLVMSPVSSCLPSRDVSRLVVSPVSSCLPSLDAVGDGRRVCSVCLTHDDDDDDADK